MLIRAVFLILSIVLAVATGATAQQGGGPPGGEAEGGAAEGAPLRVEVGAVADDAAIAARLRRILASTGWFRRERVEVRDGVVFLDGAAQTTDQREWAGRLARNTWDVVAVVNRLEVEPGAVWNFAPAFDELETLWREFVQSLPLILFGIATIVLAWWASVLLARALRGHFVARTSSPLLGALFARLVALPVLLIGLYVVLQVAGLTRLALTVLGGTGVAGIVLGFAFRDNAENYLASILLSLRRPFMTGDFIAVADHEGYVVQMNTRSTVMMTRQGNHVQIPNTTIYKSTIVNYTANPSSRADFQVSVALGRPIRDSQRIITGVMTAHKAVLADPEPFVVVDRADGGSIVLRAYFWFDFTQHAEIKLRSALIRQSLAALVRAGIPLPVETIELRLPQGADKADNGSGAPPVQPSRDDDRRAETSEEGGLAADVEELRRQGAHARAPEPGENLLSNAAGRAREGS